MRTSKTALFALLFLLAACQPLTSEPSPTAPGASARPTSIQTAVAPQPTHSSDPTTSPTPANPSVNPLTGLTVADPSILDRHPVMIKVGNFPRTGRPHAGLSFADIVFEYYVGMGFNRFLAVFYGQDAPQVGPIRSGRFVDAQIAEMYHGVLAYGNADERVDQILDQQLGDYAVAYKEVPCPPICGDDTHSVTGVYADTAALTTYLREQGVENTRPDLPSLGFDSQLPAGGQPASFLNVQFAAFDRGEWHYDPNSAKYLRWIESGEGVENLTMEPLVDRLNNQQLAFDNIVILYAFHIEYNATLHDIELWNNTAGGQALYFRDGQIFQGVWRSTGHNQPLQFLSASLTPFALKPGSTWFVLTGINSTLAQPEPGNWDMRFDIP